MLARVNEGLELEAAMVTDCGRRRALNEDAVFEQTVQLEGGESVGLYLVCDGLGGHQAGEVASRLAIETVVAELEDILLACQSRQPGFRLAKRVESAVKQANAAIRHYAETHLDTLFSLGTTMTLALIYGDVAYIANVGDSRAYIWRAGQMTQITEDHSLVAQLLNFGIINEDEVADHPHSNILSRAVGVDEQLKVDIFEWALQPGDILLLCSDGLWKAYPNIDTLAGYFMRFLPPKELCELLVADAKWRDGSDNISAVVVKAQATGLLPEARFYEAACIS